MSAHPLIKHPGDVRLRLARVEHRNAYYLAFDCFHPTWQPRHLWMWPAAKAVQYQMDANRVYIDIMIRFEPTLSPLNIVPSTNALTQAFAWGWSQMEQHMPEVRAMVQTVDIQWSGRRMEAA